ncbi:MAG: hypothetical protein EXS03_00360 [Phycisphaerales bacterium]|nr:hypothetical protein [Phycisphaerales bacterium]
MTNAVLGLLALLGFFLLIAGVRLIGLVAAFTGGTLGWCLGGILHDTLVPGWSPALCAASAAVAGAALAALFIRPAVAVAFAVAGLSLGLILGGVLIERGIAPTAPIQADGGGPPPAPEHPSSAVRVARSGLLELARTSLGEAQQAGGSPNALAGVGGRAWTAVRTRWQSVPGATRTFLLAMAGGGAVLGFGLGVVFSRWALAGASSAVGALLLVGCGLPLGENLTGAYRCPESMAAWLLLLGAVTLSGWAFQMRRVQVRAEVPAKSRD